MGTRLMSRQLGKWAEDIAAHFLERKGLRILARNFNTRFGEIDIVGLAPRSFNLTDRTRDGARFVRSNSLYDGSVVFAEVRFRGKDSYLLPEETLTTKKQKRLKIAASIYLSKFGLVDSAVRFDVVCVYKDEWFRPAKVQHIVDAF